ncbi:hypothetical protein E9228_002759 [Curtobacterium flaccumfaciens]|uniref:Holin n=1 Tax=Curtobacterium salicis TaxID=1779862 RepID=A0ABX0T9C8_9MICO|nr:hypothetical protein [Curtobacterium sp. WW7]NII42101.1 hypothetical protein [Curtobacterium sp. WW7]
MADHEKTNISVEPIWFATQRVLRTIVQVGIPAFLTFAGVLPTIIAALGLPVDGKVYLWLVSAAAVVTAVAAGLSRVMAIPTVNEWLTKIGLGSVPKSAAERQAAAKQIGEVSPPQITDQPHS